MKYMLTLVGTSHASLIVETNACTDRVREIDPQNCIGLKRL